jgi:phage-related protein
VTTPGGDLVGDAHINVDADTSPALRALQRLSRDANGRLHDMRGRFVSESSLITRSLTGAADGGDRFSGALRGLANIAGSAGTALGRAAVPLAGIGAAAGTAVPLIAGAVAALQNLAPAGAGAVTAFLAIKQATATVQLGMIGVQDAVTAAFDTSDPEAFAEAVKKLSPNAREFATAIQAAQPALQKFQQGVQNHLFRDLGEEFTKLATVALPVLSKGLNSTADTLNRMAQGASGAARELAANGTLGQAMTGANKGLDNLRRVPGQVVTALGQLAAAGAPVFDTLTAKVADVAGNIQSKLSAAFESGALQKAISAALDLVMDLGSVFLNVFDSIGNILGAVSASGAGFSSVLLSITGAIRKATATEGFQAAIGALAQTMGVIGQTVGPLLSQALGALAPVLTTLATPVQVLVQNLGAGLSSVIAGLAPVLQSAARAVGSLLVAVAPLLPVIGSLVGSLLPVFVPVIDSVAQAFTGLQPVVSQIAVTLQSVLAPAIAALPKIIIPLSGAFNQWLAAILPVATQLLAALTPALTSIGKSLGQLLVALAPVIVAMTTQFAKAITAATPVITRLIPYIAQLANVLASSLASTLRNIVMPALRLVAALLTGNFSAAWRAAKDLVAGAGRNIMQTARTVQSVFQSVFGAIVTIVRSKIASVVSTLTGLRGRISGALAGAGRLLYSAGRAVVQGMINGIRSGIGSVTAAARNLASSALSAAKSALGISSPSKAFREIGKDTGAGFIVGLTGTSAQIKKTTTSIATSITAAFKGTGSRVDDRLVALVRQGNARLQSLAAQRDSITKRIADARKFATDIASSAAGAFSLGDIVQANNGSASRISILGGLQRGALDIKRFTAQVRDLQKRGLRKDLISQLLALGPEQGGAIAASLSRQSTATLKQINAAQADLLKASGSLGRTGADALFDAGKKAGAGFLTGLKAQQKQIEQLMLNIAKSMQRAIRRALGIKSPSRVFTAIGDQTGAGLERGFAARIPALREAVREAAQAMATTGRIFVPSLVPAAPAVAAVSPVRTTRVNGQTVNMTINLTNSGVLGSQRDVQNWLTATMDTLRRQGRLP